MKSKLGASVVSLGIGSGSKTRKDGKQLAHVRFVSLFCSPWVCLLGESALCSPLAALTSAAAELLPSKHPTLHTLPHCSRITCKGGPPETPKHLRSCQCVHLRYHTVPPASEESAALSLNSHRKLGSGFCNCGLW